MILTEKLSDPYGQRLDDQGRNTIMHLWKQKHIKLNEENHYSFGW